MFEFESRSASLLPQSRILAWLMGECELCKDGDKWDACYGIGNDSGNKAMVSCYF